MIYAAFDGQSREAVASDVFQYDTGEALELSGLPGRAGRRDGRGTLRLRGRRQGGGAHRPVRQARGRVARGRARTSTCSGRGR